MNNILIKIREFIKSNSVAINGAVMLLFAIVAWFNDQGLVEDWPKTMISVFGGINLFLAWFGLEPIPLPETETISKKVNKNK